MIKNIISEAINRVDIMAIILLIYYRFDFPHVSGGLAAKPDYPQGSGHGRGKGGKLSWWQCENPSTLVSPAGPPYLASFIGFPSMSTPPADKLF